VIRGVLHCDWPNPARQRLSRMRALSSTKTKRPRELSASINAVAHDGEVPSVVEKLTRTFVQNDGAAGFSVPTCEIPQAGPAGGGETLKSSGFPEVPCRSGWRSSCRSGWRVSRVSSSSLFDRADAGSWAKRRPDVHGRVSRHDVRGMPASGLNIPQREHPQQLQNRRRRGGRVCSRRRAAHGCCPRGAERPRCSSVPIGPFAEGPGLRY